jgi:error-prone DNA polymerase
MEGRTVLEWDKDDIDALGILKVDVLALGMLTCLRRALDLLRRHGGPDLDLASLPRDCPETYAMLRRADSLGVFQVESRAQMTCCRACAHRLLRPRGAGGDRPAPARSRATWCTPTSGGAPGWSSRPTRRRRPSTARPTNCGRCWQDLGVPLFQEQAMRLAIVAARFSPEEADDLRRAMATFKYTQGVAVYRDRLVGGMVARGYDRELAERVFRQIEGFGSYGFPESHAASFAHLAYASSWVKRHHPAVFAAALLNSQPMGFYSAAQIVRDAVEHDVAARPVDANRSEWDCTLEPDPASAGGLALRLGLRLVVGLPQAEGRAVAKARRAGNGAPFASVEEVARRAGVGRRALEALAAADAFGTVGSRRAALWAAAGFERTGDLPLFAAAEAGEARGDGPLLPEPAVDLPPQRVGEEVVEDYTATGLTLRPHPLALLRPALSALGLHDTRRLDAARSGSWIKLPGLVLMRQRPGPPKASSSSPSRTSTAPRTSLSTRTSAHGTAGPWWQRGC